MEMEADEGAVGASARDGVFNSDMDFCSFCGTILPIPDYGSKVDCIRCGIALKRHDLPN